MTRTCGQEPPGSLGSYFLPTPVAPKVEVKETNRGGENTTPRALAQHGIEMSSENVTSTTEAIVAAAEVEMVEFVEGSGSFAEDGELLSETEVATENPEAEVLDVPIPTPGPNVTIGTEGNNYKYDSCSDELESMVSFLKVRKIFIKFWNFSF